MYIPAALSPVTDRRSMVTPTVPLDKSHFTLDTSGVAGVFGGEEAVSAMATVHVYKNRRWLGWYNTPGSYQIAKRYGLLTRSRFFDGFFRGIRTDPATLFEFDGWKGPKFRAAHSGTVIEETGHLAALFMKECAGLQAKEVHGRKTQAVGVTIAELKLVPPTQMYPKHIDSHSPIFASIPISVSVGTCIACGVKKDWFAFALILLGIVTSGIACAVIGSGKLSFTHPEPAEGSPPGSGILSSDKEIALLIGPEGAVNSVTRGRFTLSFASEPTYENIGWCSVLLSVQFLSQLLLIPQASLFGQIMFVTSLAISWFYNSWLSSLDKEKIQRNILFDSILRQPNLTKYCLGTRTMMMVFVLLVLHLEEPTKILNELLPNDTKVWKWWKETVVRRISNKEKLEFVEADWELDGFALEERTLLQTLYGDAQAAYGGYSRYLASKDTGKS